MNPTTIVESAIGVAQVVYPDRFITRYHIQHHCGVIQAVFWDSLDNVSNTALPTVLICVASCMHSSCAMAAHPNPFVIARNKWVVPKQRRVERLASGYSIREFRNDSQGRYWYVVTTIEVRPTKKR